MNKFNFLFIGLLGMSIISLVSSHYGSTTIYIVEEPHEHNFTHCELCEFLVSGIEKEDRRINTTIQSITDFIHAICNFIGGPIGNECDFVIKNLSDILAWIADGFTSEQICEKLDFCKKHIIYL